MNQEKTNRSLNSVSRRNFLAVGGVGIVGLSLKDARASSKTSTRAVINVVMNGGASQLDTFDPKPDSPREIRGTMRSIQTAIPGVHFSESLPQLAKRASDLVILRSLYHDAAPTHETGLQLLLTGSLVRKGLLPPNIGYVLTRVLRKSKKSQAPVAMRLGGQIERTGMNAYHGDRAGLLGDSDDLQTLDSLKASGFETPEFQTESTKVKSTYGDNAIGASLWTAAQLVRAGVKYIEVNTFPALEGKVTWDAHGCKLTSPGTIFDYRDKIGPEYDQAMSSLFDDLQSSGLWNQTLVVSSGEMGRTPRINENNGRDHWPHVWSGLLAGGGLEGGQVIGASSAHAESIEDHPIHVSEIPGLICSYLLGKSPAPIQVNDDITWQLPGVKSLLS